MAQRTLMEQPHSLLCVVIVRSVHVSEIPVGAVCLAPGSATHIRLCCHHVIISAIYFKNHQDGAFWRAVASVLAPIHIKRT